MDVVLMRKISMPGNPELALGAIAGPEGKSQILNTEMASLYGIEAATVEAPERAELVRRRNLWGRAATAGRAEVIVLVENRIATGGHDGGGHRGSPGRSSASPVGRHAGGRA
jgi:putative phosphoribosyl transferase